MSGFSFASFWRRRPINHLLPFLLVFAFVPFPSLASPRECSNFLLALYDPELAKTYLGEHVRFHRYAGQGEVEGTVEGTLENITATGLTVTLADGRRSHIPLAMVQLESIVLDPAGGPLTQYATQSLAKSEIQKIAEQKIKAGSQISPQEMRKLYEKAGWELVRITGSHHQYRIMRNGTQWVETISGVNGDIAPGLRKVLLKRLIESEAARSP